MMPWRWRIAALLALVSADAVDARKSGGGGGGNGSDLLSSVSGTYTHFHDDDLSFTVAYDLQDDSSVPFSYITGYARAGTTTAGRIAQNMQHVPYAVS